MIKNIKRFFNRILFFLLFVNDSILAFFGSAYGLDFMKSIVFRVTLSIFIVILNFYILRYFIDINNNIQFFVMIVLQKSIYSISNFLYDNINIFKSKPINWKVVYKKVKFEKNFKVENIISTLLLFFVFYT